ALKEDRLKLLEGYKSFRFLKLDIKDQKDVVDLFKKESPQRVLHLAAQAGVRYSIQNPYVYIDSNIQGFINILEGCRAIKTEHLVFASSSSVYGGNTKVPFSEHDNVDHPVSLYAATKKANELMAHTYSHLYQIPTTGLRFFTVYGPWGRPDMSPMLFTKAILADEPIQVFNHGDMMRDFTYIDDIVVSVNETLFKTATPNSNFNGQHPDPATSHAPYRIFNIGNSHPIPLMQFIETIEDALGKKAIKKMMGMQAGDIKITSADTSELNQWVNFKPNTSIKEGVTRFIDWYKNYY
ncbi:MAG: NAD-dependent epimerase/dehydratase family protein, partial [Betaproteobacteria bacterium]|nr:NAD-dependent epimerase/dehydratase family protein [Betaproteobacteria bacterium]